MRQLKLCQLITARSTRLKTLTHDATIRRLGISDNHVLSLFNWRLKCLETLSTRIRQSFVRICLFVCTYVWPDGACFQYSRLNIEFAVTLATVLALSVVCNNFQHDLIAQYHCSVPPVDGPHPIRANLTKIRQSYIRKQADKRGQRCLSRYAVGAEEMAQKGEYLLQRRRIPSFWVGHLLQQGWSGLYMFF